jgi:glycosyltransferase involved in cell wall biosynthesis
MSEPVVSVLVTAFNREEFVAEAISSALASTLGDIEVIVVDDCSVDGTWDSIQAVARLDTRVKPFRNTENLGDNRNRNQAARHASGKYLKYLDSDDIIYSYALQAFVEMVERFQDAGFGLSENPSGTRCAPYLLSPRDAYHTHFFEIDLFGRAPGSSIIRRSAFLSVGGFREFVGRGQLGDLELWLKLARSFGLVCLPRDLVWDRQHGEQESTYQRQASLERIRIERALYREALNAADCPLSADERGRALAQLTRLDAREFLREALVNHNISGALRFRKAAEISAISIFRSILHTT